MSLPTHAVCGQQTLPELEPELGYGSITRLKPQQERFAWEYVLSSSNGKTAYLAAYPGVKEISALNNATRLLKQPAIQTRIAEIRVELQRRYAVDGQAIVRLLAMTMGADRRRLIGEDGKPLELHQLPTEIAAIVDVEIVIDRHGQKHAVPVVPERMKAAIELAKMMGITKDTVEITTKEPAVRIYIPSNGRDSLPEES